MDAVKLNDTINKTLKKRADATPLSDDERVQRELQRRDWWNPAPKRH